MRSLTQCEASLPRRCLSTPLPEVLMVAENLSQQTEMLPEVKPSNTPISRLKKEIVDNIPDDWHSTSSYNSDLQKLESNIRTIAEQIDNDSKFSVEPHPPSPAVSCAFAVIYSLLGFTIVMLIILTIIFNFSMILLLSMIVIIFIIILIVTNFCVIVYQF